MLELYKRTFICFELASNKDKSQSSCIINVKAVFGIHFDDRAQKMSFLLAHLEKMQITHNWLKSNLKQNSYTYTSFYLSFHDIFYEKFILPWMVHSCMDYLFIHRYIYLVKSSRNKKIRMLIQN